MAISHFLTARLPAFALLCVGALGLGAFYTSQQYVIDNAIIASLTASDLAVGARLSIVDARLDEKLAENTGLAQQLAARDATDAQIQAAIGTITGGLTHIEKERAVDPQLLEKYSRVFFLSENYRPVALATLEARFASPSTTPRELESRTLPFLTQLLTDANAAGVHLRILSAFRSFYDQAGLKSAYTVRYGSGANAFSADQGYSEHQLGTAVDFTTLESGVLSGFDKTKGFAWLSDNAYRYGFIISYPKGNQYYIYEPWHWRFVGVALATKLHDTGAQFYDLDQREINTYRADLFDQ